MATNFDTAKEQEQDAQQTEVYVVEPSRAEYIWDDNTEEMTEVKEENEKVKETPQQANDAGVDDDLDLSLLDLPVEPEQTEADPTQTKDFESFSKEFQKFTGVDFKQAVQMMQELQTFRAERVVEAQKTELKTAWGVDGADFDARMNAVQERFSKYSPELQAKLDNPQGAQLIWAKLQQEESGKRKAVPGLDRSTTKTPAGAQPKYLYTHAQIQQMSDGEYAKHASRIAAAYAEGKVKR